MSAAGQMHFALERQSLPVLCVSDRRKRCLFLARCTASRPTTLCDVQIGADHLDVKMDLVVDAMAKLFSVITGKTPRFKVSSIAGSLGSCFCACCNFVWWQLFSSLTSRAIMKGCLNWFPCCCPGWPVSISRPPMQAELVIGSWEVSRYANWVVVSPPECNCPQAAVQPDVVYGRPRCGYLFVKQAERSSTGAAG